MSRPSRRQKQRGVGPRIGEYYGDSREAGLVISHIVVNHCCRYRLLGRCSSLTGLLRALYTANYTVLREMPALRQALLVVVVWSITHRLTRWRYAAYDDIDNNTRRFAKSVTSRRHGYRRWHAHCHHHRTLFHRTHTALALCFVNGWCWLLAGIGLFGLIVSVWFVLV